MTFERKEPGQLFILQLKMCFGQGGLINSKRHREETNSVQSPNILTVNSKFILFYMKEL